MKWLRRKRPARTTRPGAHAGRDWRRRLRWAGMVSLLLTLAALAVLVAAGTTFLQVEAHSGAVEIEFSPGLPIAWSLDGAQLLECKDLRDAVQRSAATGAAAPASESAPGVAELRDPQSIEFHARQDQDSGRLDTVQADILVVDGTPVIELRSVRRDAGARPGDTGRCDAERSAAALLDGGDGTRRGLHLPAQLRLPTNALGDGLTLEFRGVLRVGRDPSSSRQPLLNSGRLVMREVRARWLQGLVTSPYFEIEARDLTLGDRLTLRAVDADGPAAAAQADAPQGFVRIVPAERGVNMSVSATAQAARAEIVRPFSRPETPQANVIKVASRDDLVQLMFGLLGALWGLGLAIYAVLPPSPLADARAARESDGPRP